MTEDRIKKLEMQLFSEKALRQSLEETVSIHSQRQNDRIKKLEAALRALLNLDQRCGWHSKEADAAIKALEGKDD